MLSSFDVIDIILLYLLIVATNSFFILNFFASKQQINILHPQNTADKCRGCEFYNNKKKIQNKTVLDIISQANSVSNKSWCCNMCFAT